MTCLAGALSESEGHAIRMAVREYARQQLRVDVKAAFDAITRDTGRSHRPVSGRQPASRIETAGRVRRRAAR